MGGLGRAWEGKLGLEGCRPGIAERRNKGVEVVKEVE